MKIAFFGLKGIPYPAGVEVVVEELGSRLVKRGHDVTIFVRPQFTPSDITEYKGMCLIHVPSIATKNLDAISHSFLCMLKSIAMRPDIIHIQATGNSIFSLLPRLFGIPTIVTSHGLDWQRAKWGRIARTYLKLTDFSTCTFPSITTAVSQKLKMYYESRFGRNVVYIPNGAKMVENLAPNKIHELGLLGNDYLLFASRLVPEKGCHYLIEAFKKLKTDMKLVIAGGGDKGDPYAEQLMTNAGPNLLFTGFISGTLFEELLSNAYLYILPSEIEGLSVGLIEAMNYHNCVLASDIEENREVLGGTGFTFINRSIDDLKEKLDYLIAQKNIVKKQKEVCAASIIQRYNWDDITTQYENLYVVLTEKKERRRKKDV